MAFEACLAAPPDLHPPPLTRNQALFLDFDGTLVEIAPAPDLIEVPPDLPALLASVTVCLDGALAIVSGRPVAKLRRFLQPFAGLLIGQHGLERADADGQIERAASQPGLVPIRQALSDFAARHPGLTFEDKGSSVSLHYRQAPDLAGACRRLARQLAIASCGRFRVLEGHGVVELLPKSAGKGRAIAACLALPPFGGRVPVFVGDDTGDESGFDAVNRQGGVSIRVGSGPSAARYRFSAPDAVRYWLAQGLRS